MYNLSTNNKQRKTIDEAITERLKRNLDVCVRHLCHLANIKLQFKANIKVTGINFPL